MGDAEACFSGSSPSGLKAQETARAIYAHALTIFPSKKMLWLSAALLEKETGHVEALETILKDAVRNCPKVRHNPPIHNRQHTTNTLPIGPSYTFLHTPFQPFQYHDNTS